MSRLPRAETLIPFLVVFGAALLIASEFMTIFEFTPPGGEVERISVASERHNYALLILAICAVVAMLFAIATGSRSAALAVAAIGVATLLLFLILDLPDAGKLGDLEDPVRGIASAKAEPQAGFWLEAIGAIVLAISGGILASFHPDQLRRHARTVERGRERLGLRRKRPEGSEHGT
jgi:hypothetical protein